ncbi:MAG: tetratricopeptide repeat protein [Phycisphaerales bacterium]|nr:MAG: tetratricopeptide repeat protein [Phycisphaerales bacterium]
MPDQDMEKSQAKLPGWSTLWAVIVIAGLAVVVGWPSLPGDYSSGDDVQLVRDNVLVNHPSLKHAFKLFFIPAHRDLYQPVALLSFQIDFAIGERLTYLGDPRILHLHNIFSHALNAVLVFLFVRQLTRRPMVGALAGLLMAVHPMNVEAIAWINGRMMLQSTSYFLLGLMAFEHWHRLESSSRSRWGWLVLAQFLFLWTMLSKVRVELPGILVLMLIYKWHRPSKSWWLGWGIATVITGVLSYWAVITTGEGDMFKAIAVYTSGPRLARAFQSVAWYFQHYAWPANLSPWHPPDMVVTWTGGDIPYSVALVLVVLVCIGLSWRFGRTGAVGMLWFLGAVFSTLPLIGARGVTAGERYAYLPAIGLHWLSAAVIVWCAVWLGRFVGRKLSFALIGAGVSAVSVILVGIGRQTCLYYLNSVNYAHRIVALYPETPDVFVDLAWAYIRDGRYEEGIKYARMQLDYPDPDECLIYQAIAWAQYELGDYEAAEQSLLRAKRANPEYSKVYYRLGEVYAAQGRWEEAERMYAESVRRTPLYLPAQAALAQLYMQQARYDEAEARYTDILANVNPYHPQSRYNLGDIYMSRGRYDLARGQYERLLSYMPEHAMARTNLGLCLQRIGDPQGALEAYETALRYEPKLLAARLNRAALFMQMGLTEDGIAAYRSILEETPAEREALTTLSDMLLDAGQEAAAMRLWDAAVRAEPDAPDVKAGRLFALSRTSEFAAVVAPAQEVLESDSDQMLARIALGIALNRGGDAAGAADTFDEIARRGGPHPPEAIDQGIDALAQLSARQPESPWPYYFTARLLEAAGRTEAAALGMGEFRRLCREPSCAGRAGEGLGGSSAPLDNN